MIQEFDFNNQAEAPAVVLCNPDKTELYSLGGVIYKTKLTERFNALSEFEFEIPSSVDGGVTQIDSYDSIQAKREISIENHGWYVIDSVEEKTEGNPHVKVVKCKSLEVELIYKRFTAFTGTFKFYNLIPTGKVTLMDRVLQLLPTWQAGNIDLTVANKYRTFDITDKTIYDFLMNDAERAYDCVFSFDTVNKLINVKSSKTAAPKTDIFLSYDNLIKNSSLVELSDELVTALYVYGAGTLDVRAVNPLGTNVIYNFGYYQSTQWMPQSLIDDLAAWEHLIDINQETYANYLTDLRILNTELATLEADLLKLKGEYTAIETELKTAIQAKLPDAIAAANAKLKAKNTEIIAKKAQIKAKKTQITAKNAQIKVIHDTLSFNANFTLAQRKILSEFTFENTFRNDNIVVTDISTPMDYQDAAQELYDQAIDVLVKAAEPRYEFRMDTSNFIALKEYTPFTSQLALGSSVTVSINDDYLVTPVLLEIVTSFDDPSQFSLTFSNRLRLSFGNFTYTDLATQAYSTGSTVLGNSQSWGNWTNSYKDTVAAFISSALDASLNEIINASNQEILINANGLKGRKSTGTDTYDPHQVWLTNNLLAFSKDNWDTASLAIGRLTWNNKDVYGIVGDAIVGRILAGNTLQITNEGSNFILDENGAVLNNASFTIQNSKNAIILTPKATTVNGIVSTGISIQHNDPIKGWEQVFYTDTKGNLVIKGNIDAGSGSIGGWKITTIGLSDKHGNYINSDGNVKLGGLKIEPGTATFSGDIYASHFHGQVDASNYAPKSITPPSIGFLDAGLLTTGILNANNIYWTGAIRGPGFQYKSEIDFQKGYLEITGDEGVRLHATPLFYGSGKVAGDIFIKQGFISIQSDLTTLDGANGGVIQLGTKTEDKIVVGGPSGGTGLTTNFSIMDILGVTQNLTFSKGILTDGVPPPNGPLDLTGASGGTGRSLRFTAVDSLGVARNFIFTNGIFNDGIPYVPPIIEPPITPVIPDISWTIRFTGTLGAYMSYSTYSNSQATYVIVGDGPNFLEIAASGNGTSWDTILAPAPNLAPKGVEWAEWLGKFIIINDNTTDNILMSPNGYDWTSHTISTAHNPSGAFATSNTLGTMVAQHRSYDHMVYSNDGLTWYLAEATERFWNRTIWSPEKELFVGVALNFTGTQVIQTSTTGTSWTLRNAPSGINLSDVCWSAEKNLFVACGYDYFESGNSMIITSSDGINWSEAPDTPYKGVNGADNALNAVNWFQAEHVFIAIGYKILPDLTFTDVSWVSADGLTWYERTLPNAGFYPDGVVHGDPGFPVFIAHGGGQILSMNV